MMPRQQRAYIFQAFDALKGFRELLYEKERIVVEKRELSEDDLEMLDQKIHEVQQGDIIKIIYYDGKEYIQKTAAKIYLAEIQAFDTWSDDEISMYIKLMEKYANCFRQQVEMM